jgi:hypothetical protein
VQKKALQLIQKHLESLADLGYIDHFKHASQLKEHPFKGLSQIVSNDGIGKKNFRQFVEIFLDPTFRNTKDSNQNCGFSAQDFLLNMN